MSAPPQERRVSVAPATGIVAERVRWTWRGRIPRGALTLLAGQPGLGKSTLTIELAARLTTGTLDGHYEGHPAPVLIVTLEDHLASVVKPRLVAAGADLEHVFFLRVTEHGADGLLTLPDDVAAIEQLALETNARMLIVDPVVAALSGSIDGNRDQSIRRALAPLAALSERRDLATIAVVHLNKQQVDLLSRIGGSVGFVGAARSVLAFTRDPDDPDGEAGSQRIVLHAKSNWGRHADTLSARIESVDLHLDGDVIDTSKLVITGTSSVTIEQLNRAADDATGSDVEEIILAELGDGERWSHEVKQAVMGSAGCGQRTVEYAATRLIKSGELIVSQTHAPGKPRMTAWSRA